MRPSRVRHLFVIPLLLGAALGACDSAGPEGPPWYQPPAAFAFDYEPGDRPLLMYQPRREIPAQLRAVEMRLLRTPPSQFCQSQVGCSTPPNVTWTIGQQTGDIPTVGVFSRYLRLPLNGSRVEIRDDGLYVGSTRVLSPVADPNEEQAVVDTRAGVFHATVRERRFFSGGSVREFWTWEDGLVRLDVFHTDGVFGGRFVRSAPD